MRLSVELLPDAPAVEVLAAIKAADESAIDTVFCVDELYHRDAWAPEEVAERIRAEILPSGFQHVSLALSDAAIPRAWARTDIPGLPSLSRQVQLIADRLLPLLAA